MNIRNKLKNINIQNFNFLAIFVISLIIIVILSALIYVIISKNQVAYAYSSVSEEKVSMKEFDEVDIYQYIVKNVEATETEEIIKENIDLEYTTTYIEDPTLASGVLNVVQEGRDGIQEVIVKKKYIDGNLMSEEIVKNKITRATINKIVKIGTAPYSSNYEAKVGDKLYVTSDRLTMRKDTDEDSGKVTVLKQNEEVEIIEISENWYKIKVSGMTGWVQSASLTNLNPYDTLFEGKGLSKEQAISKCNFNMKLNQKSGLSLNQFKKVLADSKDKNGIFAKNAEYFYYIEKEYGINGIFVAAVGIHESAWGTSKIASNKKNLFGYGASDSDPYNNAYNFSNYSEGIDLVARVFVKYYINEPGTKIYDGTASGKYYSSSTLSGVGKKYATDTNWAKAVYKWMEYLYNKI